MGKKNIAERMVRDGFRMGWKLTKKLSSITLKLVWQVIVIAVKLYLAVFYVVSRLIVASLTNFNKAIEEMIFK